MTAITASTARPIAVTRSWSKKNFQSTVGMRE